MFLKYLSNILYIYIYIFIQFFLFLFLYFYYFNVIILFFFNFLINYNINYFIFTNIFDLILIKFIIIINCSLFSIFPYFLIYFYCYIISSLYEKEYKQLKKNIFFYLTYLLINFYIFYKIILIKCIFIFLSSTNSLNYLYTISFEPKIDLYYYFILKIFFFYIFMIHIPYILYFLIKLNIIKFKTLIEYKKLIIIIILMLSLNITPPDLGSFIYLFILICVFLELFIYFNLFLKIKDLF